MSCFFTRSSLWERLSPSFRPKLVWVRVVLPWQPPSPILVNGHMSIGLTFFPHPCKGSKFRSEQFRFGHMLTQLQRQPMFQLHEFEVVIDSIRDCVAEVKWAGLISGCGLVSPPGPSAAALEPPGGRI